MKFSKELIDRLKENKLPMRELTPVEAECVEYLNTESNCLCWVRGDGTFSAPLANWTLNSYDTFRIDPSWQPPADLIANEAEKPSSLPVEPRIEAEGTLTEPMRVFESGASRDTDNGKLDFEGFLSPLVLERYAEYMHKNRQTPNGLRGSDNWQGLFGDKHEDVCMKSLMRHIIDLWKAHRGFGGDKEELICACLFNLQAYLFKLVKDKANAK